MPRSERTFEQDLTSLAAEVDRRFPGDPEGMLMRVKHGRTPHRPPWMPHGRRWLAALAVVLTLAGGAWYGVQGRTIAVPASTGAPIPAGFWQSSVVRGLPHIRMFPRAPGTRACLIHLAHPPGVPVPHGGVFRGTCTTAVVSRATFVRIAKSQGFMDYGPHGHPPASAVILTATWRGALFQGRVLQWIIAISAQGQPMAATWWGRPRWVFP
jgi:hypothetical protein